MPLGLRAKASLSLLIGGLAIAGAAMIMAGTLQETIKRELTGSAAQRYVQYHKEKTLGGINADLALARKMADSRILRQWVQNPADAAAPAMEELRSFLTLFSTHAAFVASKPAGTFYFIDEKSLAGTAAAPLKPAQSLTRDDKDDEWFFSTLEQKEPYNFNVDHNEKLNVTKLWMNVVMKDGGVPIGVVGTGIDISRFIEEFVKTGETGVNGMFITADGAIQGHADQSLIALNVPVSSAMATSTVWSLLPDATERQQLQSAMDNLREGARNSELLTLTLQSRPYVAAIAYIPPLKWYTVALLDPSVGTGSGWLVPVMGIVVLALLLGGVLVFVGGNRSVVLPLRRIAEATHRIGEGDYSVRLPDGRADEIGEVASAFNRMVEALEESQRQVRSNTSAIAVALQHAESFEELSRILFSHLAPLLRIGQASFYRVVEGEERLLLCGGYARVDGASPEREIAFGDGLLGQCAVDRSAVVIEHPPEDYVRIASGLGEAPPACIVLRPVLSTGALLGVIELALTKPLDGADTALLDGLLPILGMNMAILARNINTRQLLVERQEQAERMERQTARLEEQSVEMEAQHVELLGTESWYRGIIESSPDGILVVDAAGQILVANANAEELFGYARGELPGTNAGQLLPGLSPRMLQGRLQVRTADDRAPSKGEDVQLSGRRRDGSAFEIQARLTPLPTHGAHDNCLSLVLRGAESRKEILV